MTEKVDRDRLAEAVKSDRLRIHGTVEKARQAVQPPISRGSWDAVERGKSVKPFTLAAIEKALGWDQGRAEIILFVAPHHGSKSALQELSAEENEHLAEVEAAPISESTKEYVRQLQQENRRLRGAG